MKEFRKTLILTIFLLLALGSVPLTATSQIKPLTYPEIITALNSKLPNSVFKTKAQVISWLVGEIKKRKAEKSLSQEMEETLRQSGATDELIKTIKENIPSAPNPVHPETKAKLYTELSESEKKQFIETKANQFLDKFGRTEANKISEQGLELIKTSVDDYVKRLLVNERTIGNQNGDGMVSKNICNYGRGNLISVLKRGSGYSSAITESFKKVGVQPEVGIYLAFGESEFCPCIQSPTGILGMFQLTRLTAEIYGLKVKKGASPNNPDERCTPKSAAQASALYLKMLADKFYGKDTNGILFAVAAFNSGEGALNKNIRTVRESGKTQVTFWDLVENKSQLIQQFQAENFRYVPRFLAAAIIGENPKSFGIVEVQPLSGDRSK